jgi:hypothetical protein
MSFDEDDFDPWDVVSFAGEFCRRVLYLSFVNSPRFTTSLRAHVML